MIYFQRDWHGPSWADGRAAQKSLGLFAGHPCDSETTAPYLLAELAAPRARPRPGWRAARAFVDCPVLLSGWLDDAPGLAAELDIAATDHAAIYGAAYVRWGSDADRRLTGCYAVAMALPDGRVRLARSPWGGRSLFYHNDGDALLACSIVRPLFAAGLAKRLRPDGIDRLVTMQLPDDEESLFEDVMLVPHGSEMVFEPGRGQLNRWYDPLAIKKVRLGSDQDYVEAAQTLLRDAVHAALRPARRPGTLLSGGLDSPLVCAEILTQLPPDERLPSFTFHPLAEFRGAVPPGKFADDSPIVERFARMHPRLDPHYLDGAGDAFDDRADQVFAACDAGYPARVLGASYHAPMRAAAAMGCDWLLGADLGNLTFSNAAPWAPAEMLRTGRWTELLRLAQSQSDNPQPLWRRIAAQALMPNLPQSVQDTIRRTLGKDDRARNAFANPFLRSGARLSALRDQAAVRRNIMTVDRTESRRAYVLANYQGYGVGTEIVHGYEQVFGIGLRDVTAYRPLIEFSLGLPTDQLVRRGETRWLARRMAIGRMPEAQRTSTLYGEHNADWRERLGPRRAELRRSVAGLAEHPQLGEVLDTEAMQRALDDWPEQHPASAEQTNQLRFYLPAMLYVAQFIDHTTGRNRR